MPDESTSSSAARQSRLAPADRTKELLPWRRAKSMTKCSLYWLPVSAFPAPQAEKAWLLRFATLFGSRMKASFEAEPWLFFQYKTAVTVHDEFIRHAQEFMPLMGLGRRPGATIPDLPSDAELQAAVDAKRKLDVNKYMADYVYWFLIKSDQRQRELFQGLGGMTILYRKPDAKAKPPELTIPAKHKDHELFQRFDVQALLAGACSMQDEFLKKSKAAFGSDMKHVQAEFLPFILPLLTTADFFALKEEELKTHFDLFDVYFHESPIDHGIVLGSKHDLDDILIDVLEELERVDPPLQQTREIRA